MSTTNIPGWDIDCPKRKHYHICQNWYCYKSREEVGSIKTTLSGNGRAKLNFGNCWTSGVVKVFLDNIEIASATSGTASTTVEFDYNDGNELKLVEENVGIIVFNSFEELSSTPTGKQDRKVTDHLSYVHLQILKKYIGKNVENKIERAF